MPVALQQSNAKTQVRESTFKYDNQRINAIVERINKHIEKEQKTPIEHYEVKHPKYCPFERQICEKCKDGSRVKYHPEDTVKMEYDVTRCYQIIVYRQLLDKSGLKGIQKTHLFHNAMIDDHNKLLYSYLAKWNPINGKGIYIKAKKSERNPQGNGTGKSYALHALAQKLCQNGIPCLYVRTVDFLLEIRSTYDEYAKENEMRVLQKYINIPVLLWDDLGKESFKKENTWAPEKFYNIIDERVTRNKPTVISSNFDIEQLEIRFGEDNYGPAIVSRLLNHCEYYSLGGDDRRIQSNGVG